MLGWAGLSVHCTHLVLPGRFTVLVKPGTGDYAGLATAGLVIDLEFGEYIVAYQVERAALYNMTVLLWV